MKKLLLTTVLVFSSFLLNAQIKMWQQVEENTIENKVKARRASFPQEYKLWKLDLQNLKNQLRNAPVRGRFQGVSNVIIMLPNEMVNLKDFEC